MITETLVEQLRKLRLHGMAESLERQSKSSENDSLRFEERLALMIQNESIDRANQSFDKRRRWAKIPIGNACIEEIDHTLPRDIDRLTLNAVCELGWIKQRLNVLITGPTGIGKSYLSSALAHAACRADYSVRCYKIPKLAAELTRAHALQRRSNFLKQLATADLLVLDDLSASSLTDTFKRDLLEILDDRYDRKSTLVTSQLLVSAWHDAFGDPTLADAILDRLVHNAYKLEPSGESIRKLRGLRRPT
jgi:DNA replication protein DnaC